jgi:dTDP-4-amino-4,6-dideoxygalactose transaminase
MNRLGTIAEKNGLVVIEDAAQSIGAKFEGKPCGAIGSIGCFSFYPTKNLGGCGDAGMMTTDSEELATQLRRLANHGMEPRYYHSMVGVNSRLDTFQAVALNAKLNHLDEYTAARQDNANYYRELMEQTDLTDRLELPGTDSRCDHVWNQFTVRVPEGRRDEVRAGLQQRGVGSEIYYPVPLHRQECFEGLGYRQGDLPHTEKAAAEVLSLPIFPELTRREQEYVVDSLVQVMQGLSGLRMAS